jgi:hypothetical protein
MQNSFLAEETCKRWNSRDGQTGNEESNMCIVPEDYRVLHKLLDTNNDGTVTETEISSAISILEKAKKEKQRKQQKEAFSKFYQKGINNIFL